MCTEQSLSKMFQVSDPCCGSHGPSRLFIASVAGKCTFKGIIVFKYLMMINSALGKFFCPLTREHACRTSN